MDVMAERSAANRPARAGRLPAAASFTLALLAVAACAGEEGALPDAPDRLEDLHGTRWSPAEETSLRVSEVEWAGRSIPLFPIRHASFRPNGELLIGVAGAEQVLLRLGRDGEVLASAGGPGEGPGEFLSMRGVVDAGDEFLVRDTRLRRLTRFDDEGAVLGSVRLEVEPGWRLLGEMQPDVLVMAPSIFSTVPGETRTYELQDGSGGPLGRLEGLEEPQGSIAMLEVREGGRRSTFSTDLPDCLVGPVEAVADGRIYAANSVSEPGVLMALDRDGGREVVHTTKHLPLVTERLLDEVAEVFEFAERAIRRPSPAPYGVRVPEDPSLVPDSIRAILDRIGEVGTALPAAWDELVIDRSSRHVWLRRNSCDGPPDQDQVWEVVDMDGGGPQAAAIIPDSLQVRDVQYPRLLAIVMDSLDVEHLVVVELLEREGEGVSPRAR